MKSHDVITVSKTGIISYYTPPQTTPHKTIQTQPPQLVSNTLPLFTHQKSAIIHPSTKTRFSTAPITAITTTPQLIVTGNSEGFINILYPGNEITLSTHVNAVTELRICDAAETLLSSGIDGFVHITRLSHPDKPFASLRHALPVITFAIGYSSTTARVITSSTDNITRVFHMSSTKLLASIQHSERVTSLAIGPTEDFWWGGSQGAVGRIDINALPMSRIVHGAHFAKRQTPVGGLVYSPHGIVVGFDDGIVQIFDPVTNVLLSSFGGGPGIMRVFFQYDDDEDLCPDREIVVGSPVCPKENLLKDFADVFDDADAEEGPDETGVPSLELEIERLRKRNRQLEDAGSRLIELVERDR